MPPPAVMVRISDVEFASRFMGRCEGDLLLCAPPAKCQRRCLQGQSDRVSVEKVLYLEVFCLDSVHGYSPSLLMSSMSSAVVIPRVRASARSDTTKSTCNAARRFSATRVRSPGGEGEPAGHDHVADAAGELLVEGEVDAPTLGRFGCKYKCESFRSAGP